LQTILKILGRPDNGRASILSFFGASHQIGSRMDKRVFWPRCGVIISFPFSVLNFFLHSAIQRQEQSYTLKWRRIVLFATLC